MGNPHILAIPYPAQGHVIPLMELSLFLARYGVKITFLNIDYIHEVLIKDASAADDIGDEIDFVSFSDGLSAEDRNKPGKSSEAILRVMPGKVEVLIEQINATSRNRISCILADQSFGWALEIAEKKGIQRAAFCPAAAAQLVLGFSIPKLIEDGIIDNVGTPTKKQIIKLSPTMPPMNTQKFVWTCLGNANSQRNIFRLMVRNNESMKLTERLLCNSTYDLEPAAFTLAPNILPVGPLLAICRLGHTATTFWPEDSSCLDWLDQQPAKSVLYAAFGSFTVFDPKQLQELALGLELTNRPFLWVVRSDVNKGTSSSFLEEFQVRVGSVGRMVTRAPQQKVLAHPSVACFVSHCGWNSTVEGVSNGVPFICWPYFADQFCNQSYICDVWRIGLALDKDENGIITRGEIKEKVDQVLSNVEFIERALDLKELVINSAKEGGSSYQNLMKFVEWISSS